MILFLSHADKEIQNNLCNTQVEYMSTEACMLRQKYRNFHMLYSFHIQFLQIFHHCHFVCTFDIVGNVSVTDNVFVLPYPIDVVLHLPNFHANQPCSRCRTTRIINQMKHDDVIKWKHFPRNWPFVRGIHRSPVNSPHKGQWRGALMFTLICARINGWVNTREAGDLRRYRPHYDVIVMNTKQRGV